jgi:ribonuclease HII
MPKAADKAQARASLAQLRQRHLVEGVCLPTELEAQLAADPRAGAQALLAAIHKRRHASRAEGQRLRRMLQFERALWEGGTQYVAGVDEAGVSPLAGPVAAAAVILPVGCRIADVDDSKKLSAAERERLAEEIRQQAVSWAVVMVEPEEIDELNIYWAGIAAMERAVAALQPAAEHLLVDARRLERTGLPYQAIIKGDAKSLSIAAASILAKTTRDRLMIELDARYPGYGLARHKGYPVAEHKEALRRLGLSPIHRRSFPIVKELTGPQNLSFGF